MTKSQPLVDTPPCANEKRVGWCGTCWYCKVRVCGPEWWLLPDATLQAKMAAAPRSEEEAAGKLGSK